MTEHDGSKRTRIRIAGAAALVLVTLIAYLPAIHAGYIWDDDSYVTENVLLHDLEGLGRIWIPRETPQYYPIVFTTFWVEYQLWELNPMGYHVVNVLLHAANALLLWLVMARLGVPGAWLIGAVFALHPVHVESVAWITERKNVLSMFFYLVAAITYLRFDALRFGNATSAPSPVESPRSVADSAPWAWYAAAMLVFLLALLSKSVTCSLPAALILAMLWLREPITVKRLLPLAPMFLIGFVLAMNTAMIERVHVGALGADFEYSFIERGLIASRALLFYPGKLLWPAELMFIYPRWDITASSLAAYLPLLVVLIIAAALVEAYRRGWRGPFVALSFYAGTVFPAIGFFNVYPHLFSFVADHFVYHASIGVIAFVIGSAAYLIPKPAAHRIAAAAVLPVLFALTYLQSTIYEDAETVWRDTIAKNPDAWMPRNNLSSILLRQSEQLAMAGHPDESQMLAAEARHHADAAIEVRPQHHTSHANRSEALRLMGDLEPALQSMKTAVELAPHFANYYWQLGRLHHHMGQLDKAAEAMAAAVDRAPGSMHFRLDLARLLVQQGNFDAAAEHFTKVIELDAGNIVALGSLAGIREQQEAYADAHRLYQQALEAAQSTEDQLQIVTRLIRFLVTVPDPELRDPEQAIGLAEQVVQFTERQDPTALAMLSSVYSEAGQFDRAVSVGREAIAIARSHGMYDLADQIASQLRQFEND